MDAQRFDLDRKRSHSAISLMTPDEENQDSVSLLDFLSSSSADSDTNVVSLTNLEAYYTIVPPIQASANATGRLAVLDAQRYDFSKSHHNHRLASNDVSPATTVCSSPTFAFENDPWSQESNPTSEEVDHASNSEVGEEVEGYTICRIIRPMPSSPILNIFSRPSSPVSFTSRVGCTISLDNLNCFGSTMNFEEDVDIYQAQRAQRADALRIFVTQTTEVHTKESLRDPLQNSIYGPNPSEAQAQVVACCD
ncbi:hypothetical protein C0991_005014 [Blastosporella zonata]|nr:hypothetical protein C0991_005014 [Blastosporella zonata]